MRAIENQNGGIFLNGLIVAFGVILALMPWYLELGSETYAARNAWICGGLIAIVGLMAISLSYDWEEYLNLAIGLWAAVAPWVLGFAAVTHAMWAHVVAGLAVVALAGLELWRLYQVPTVRSI